VSGDASTIDEVAPKSNLRAIVTVGDRLYWAYANLAMAHAAVETGASRYGALHYMIRSRLYNGLKSGSMQIGRLAQDERLKMILPQACCYCAGTTCLAADHLIPRKRGGADSGDNLVWACRSCNSSKGACDALEWLAKQDRFPPLLLLRRYLKLAIEFSLASDLMNVPLTEAPELPFVLTAIPILFPPPVGMQLWVGSLLESA
jgi:HNH endonuclease